MVEDPPCHLGTTRSFIDLPGNNGTEIVVNEIFVEKWDQNSKCHYPSLQFYQ